METSTRSSLAGLLALMLCLVPVSLSQKSAQGSQVTVPNRPAKPLYKGEQGKQQSEIEFTASSRTVTVKLQVEDANGYFLPNIRRENFAVYEDGVRQKNATVEVEHSPVSVALLMEFGGRYQELNKALGPEVREVGRQLLDVLGRDDKIAVLKYNEKLEALVDFNQSHELVDTAFEHLGIPGFSEANFYDALLETLNRMRGVSGRKAIIVVSSGLDTFSKTTYQQVLQTAQDSATPIYTIGLAQLIRREGAVHGATAPFARIDWNSAEKQLEMLAKVSGGRAYVLDSDIAIPAIYDDIMENLRLRYVITYVSSNAETSGGARRIRVELIDPRTGEALRIRDSSGKAVTARVFVQESYSPGTASGNQFPFLGTQERLDGPRPESTRGQYGMKKAGGVYAGNRKTIFGQEQSVSPTYNAYRDAGAGLAGNLIHGSPGL